MAELSFAGQVGGPIKAPPSARFRVWKDTEIVREGQVGRGTEVKGLEPGIYRVKVVGDALEGGRFNVETAVSIVAEQPEAVDAPKAPATRKRKASNAVSDDHGKRTGQKGKPRN